MAGGVRSCSSAKRMVQGQIYPDLAPSKIMKLGIIESKVMADFMKDRTTDLSGGARIWEAECHVRFIEDRDAIRRHTEVVDTPLGKRYTFVQSENANTLRILVSAGLVLHNDGNILHLCCYPFGKSIEDGLYGRLEFLAVHHSIVASTRVRPHWKESRGTQSGAGYREAEEVDAPAVM